MTNFSDAIIKYMQSSPPINLAAILDYMNNTILGGVSVEQMTSSLDQLLKDDLIEIDNSGFYSIRNSEISPCLLESWQTIPNKYKTIVYTMLTKAFMEFRNKVDGNSDSTEKEELVNLANAFNVADAELRKIEDKRSREGYKISSPPMYKRSPRKSSYG